jgi:hypothetical protein
VIYRTLGDVGDAGDVDDTAAIAAFVLAHAVVR